MNQIYILDSISKCSNIQEQKELPILSYTPYADERLAYTPYADKLYTEDRLSYAPYYKNVSYADELRKKMEEGLRLEEKLTAKRKKHDLLEEQLRDMQGKY